MPQQGRTLFGYVVGFTGKPDPVLIGIVVIEISGSIELGPYCTLVVAVDRESHFTALETFTVSVE